MLRCSLLSACALLAACGSEPADKSVEPAPGNPDSGYLDPGHLDSGDSDPSASPCEAPLVLLQSGPDSTCTGGNEHYWPVGLAASDCHAWSATAGGQVHENSANEIRCNADGTFSFTQYAGSMDCSGTGVTKTYSPNTCEQDIPPSLYTKAGDLSCCLAPESAECTTGVPSVSVPGGEVFLNGEACTAP